MGVIFLFLNFGSRVLCWDPVLSWKLKEEGSSNWVTLQSFALQFCLLHQFHFGGHHHRHRHRHRLLGLSIQAKVPLSSLAQSSWPNWKWLECLHASAIHRYERCHSRVVGMSRKEIGSCSTFWALCWVAPKVLLETLEKNHGHGWLLQSGLLMQGNWSWRFGHSLKWLLDRTLVLHPPPCRMSLATPFSSYKEIITWTI